MIFNADLNLDLKVAVLFFIQFNFCVGVFCDSCPVDSKPRICQKFPVSVVAEQVF